MDKKELDKVNESEFKYHIKHQELRKLGLPKEDFRFSKLSEEVVLNPEDPIENVGIEKETLHKIFCS